MKKVKKLYKSGGSYMLVIPRKWVEMLNSERFELEFNPEKREIVIRPFSNQEL
jgi:antitoxin component of MazEF toxin-antitoxin module